MRCHFGMLLVVVALGCAPDNPPVPPDQPESGAQESPSPWRADPLPAECRPELLDEGLPYRQESGAVHILAWANVADDYLRDHEGTRALVIKRFDRPTQRGGQRWVLALVHRSPKNPRWYSTEWHHTDFPGDPPVQLTDAEQSGYEFYPDRPTDEQVVRFLRKAEWDLQLGAEQAYFGKGTAVIITRTLTAGGVDTAAWRQVFERDVPAHLFPELVRGDHKK